MTVGVTQAAAIERHARTLFAGMAEGLVVCEAIRNPAGRLVDYWIRDANPVFLARAPEGPGAVGRRLLEMRPTTPPYWFARCEEALDGKDVRFEFQDPLSGRWYDAHMKGLSSDEFSQFFMDISHRKAAEARQQELFDELNHRVKNNLAIVSSMLELQGRESSPEVRRQLDRAVGRVRTIADLHNLLHQQHGADRVNLSDYLGGLCDRLREAFLEARAIRLDVDCETIFLTARDAVSLGLIVNELVTNALKHAFRGVETGCISISLTGEGEGLRLRVSDDGVGYHARGGEGLGLRLVRALAEGMNAQVRLSEGPGAAIEVVIAGLPAVEPPELTASPADRGPDRRN